MWNRKYKDYPKDSDMLKEKIESGKGIIGCEMHEVYGWAEAYEGHNGKSKKPPVKRVRKGGFSDK